MNQLIVPTDFSDAAWNAYAYAVSFAEKFDVKNITLLNTYEEPRGKAGKVVSILDVIKEESENEMSDLIEKIKSEGSGKSLNIVGKSIEGSLVDIINELVEIKKESVVIMGTVGKTGILEKLIGSNASDVISEAICPVFVIPPHCTFSTNKISFASDFKNLPSDSDLAYVKQLSSEFKSTLNLVHVVDSDAAEASEVNAKLTEISSEIMRLKSSNVVTSLDEHVTNSETDLLVLVKKNKGLFERIFQESVTKELTIQARIPLLILKTVS